MERFLLFDSGCSLCSQLADIVEYESNGWLTARSLREPTMQSLLNKANPNWQWKPILMEVQGENIRTFTGLQFQMRLLTGLGPRRSWRITQALYQASSSSQQTNRVGVGRRSFLRRSGAVLAAIAFGLGVRHFVSNQNVYAQIAGTQNPLTITYVDINDAIIEQLRQTSAVYSANVHFGTPNWQRVQKVEHHLAQESIYVIPYESHKNQPIVKGTFLAIMGSSLKGVAKSLVGQLLHADTKTQEFAWLTPDGHYVVDTIGYRDGNVKISTRNFHALGVGTVQPDINLSCFNSCLGAHRVVPWCIPYCDFCVINGDPGNCAVCFGCASGAYLYCLAQCLFS